MVINPLNPGAKNASQRFLQYIAIYSLSIWGRTNKTMPNHCMQYRQREAWTLIPPDGPLSRFRLLSAGNSASLGAHSKAPWPEHITLIFTITGTRSLELGTRLPDALCRRRLLCCPILLPGGLHPCFRGRAMDCHGTLSLVSKWKPNFKPLVEEIISTLVW